MRRLTRWAEGRWSKRAADAPKVAQPDQARTATFPTAPGWYPDPEMVATQRYWDGNAWTDHVAPTSSHSSIHGPNVGTSQAYVVLVLAGSAIGFVMALQSASLLTGTGTQWTGVAVTVAAGIVSRVVRESIPGWVRVLAVLAALIAFVNVIYLENQLDQRRQEIQKILR